MLRLPLPFLDVWGTVDNGCYFCRMNRAFFLKISALAMLLVVALLFVQSAWPSGIESAESPRFSEKVNLALRRTAHHLLLESGDSTSRIPAVQRTLSSTWVVRMERQFDYDRLPALLQESLDIHGIGQGYDVAVLSCTDNVLQLGYNFMDIRQSQGAACGGRSLESGCYNLQITFAVPESPATGRATLWLGFCCVLAGIFVLAWRWSLSKAPVLPEEQAPDASPQALRLGNSSFDAANQTLVSGNVQHHLTYREAKLLQLFASSPNRVLERDFILKSVWEDEGIMVGRSVDVFVSRLRKMLRDDPALRLVAVHGVGYRLEVA